MEHEAARKIKDAIRRQGLIKAGMHIVAGLSGGPDSTCLFHALAAFRAEAGFTLSAVHMNHMLREEAGEDARWAEELCRRAGAEFFGFARDVAALAREWGVSEEEAGRRVRYEAFFEVAEKIRREKGLLAEKVRIALAHNKNDQAETVLMRLIRGTGPDGLAAMAWLRESREGFAVIRPMLGLERAEIEDYCLQMGLAPRRDPTNEASVYLRNKIRLELLPELAGYNARIVDGLARLAASAAEDREYFDGLTDEMLEDDGGGLFPLRLFADARPALRHRLIVKCFERAGLTQDVESAHLHAADRLIEAGTDGKSIDFPGEYRLTLRREELCFSKKPACRGGGAVFPPFQVLLQDLRENEPVRFKTGDYMGYISHVPAGLWAERQEKEPPDKTQLALDFDLLAGAAAAVAIRGRRPGDWIRPQGMDGSKKIQDFFVDAKIPREDRDRTPLAAAGGEVLQIFGSAGRKTANYAINGATKRVFLLEYIVRA
ncbi:MAG: tRNA lysidine(34) synthetase TilS [Clostridiales Family XIII bacterium]|jgi:tRNA(Ile)-lysidine synthase|nr:tRNA lysidine(34) synthetase TilS [Clostridiales Family XIII bacterium]